MKSHARVPLLRRSLCTLVKLTLLLALCPLAECLLDQQPQQVHLSLGSDETSITVTWVTFDELTDAPLVEYGEDATRSSILFPHTRTGETSRFTDGGSEGRILYIHRVQLTSLTSNTRYYYRVGSPLGWSTTYTFKTLAPWPSPSANYTIALYGNLGNENAQSLARLQSEVSRGALDVVIHIGDIAVDLADDNGRTGDQFMSQIEPMAANTPYQVVVGDRESAYNYSHYNERFTMIDTTGAVHNHYYSFNVGPVHFISYSTEVYFSSQYATGEIERQYAWLSSDLVEANRVENRRLRPWIITLGHRPMYTCVDSRDFARQCDALRTDSQHNSTYSLERLFYTHSVDVIISSHGGIYERMYPMYNGKIVTPSADGVYVNTRAPIHLTTSSAGSRENVTSTTLHSECNMSGQHTFDYGYTRLYINNSTHITFNQVSDDQDGKIVDSFTIVKHHNKGHSELVDDDELLPSNTREPLIKVNSSVTSEGKNKSKDTSVSRKDTASTATVPAAATAFSFLPLSQKEGKSLSKSITSAPAVEKTKAASQMHSQSESSAKSESKNTSS